MIVRPSTDGTRNPEPVASSGQSCLRTASVTIAMLAYSIVASSVDAAGANSASIRAAGVAGTATITASAVSSVGAGTGPASSA